MMTDVRYGPITDHDVAALAHLHQRAFPGFFLSTLGERFLVQFYRGFLVDESAISIVATDDNGVPRGAVVGTTEPDGFFGRLVRRQWAGFVAASLAAVLRRPPVAVRLLKAVRYRGDVSGAAGAALLSSICVDPDWQGRGVGRRLVREWEKGAAVMGATGAVLTTDALDNAPANGFYVAQGWQVDGEYETSEGRLMVRYTKRLGNR
jgi:ribosomal protein S18 acetylase RimI-like enzyme